MGRDGYLAKDHKGRYKANGGTVVNVRTVQAMVRVGLLTETDDGRLIRTI